MAKSHLKFLTVGEHRHKSSFFRHIYLAEPIHIPVDVHTSFADVFTALRAKFEKDPDVLAMVDESEKDQDAEVLTSKVLAYDPEPDVKLFAIFDIVPAHS